jgi:hypothetical protein
LLPTLIALTRILSCHQLLLVPRLELLILLLELLLLLLVLLLLVLLLHLLVRVETSV